MSIKIKWTLAFFLLITLTLAVEWVILRQWITRDLERELQLRLVSEAKLLASLVEQSLNSTDNLRDAAQYTFATQRFETSIRVRVGRVDGRIVFDSGETGKPEETLPPESLEAVSGTQTSWQSQDTLYVAYPIRGAEEVIGVLECSSPRTVLSSTLTLLNHALLGTMLLAAGVGVVLAFAISAALVNPIRELETVAVQIANGSWQKRVRFKRSDELGQLAETIHDMARNLEQQFRQIEGEKTTLQALLASMIDGLIVLDDKQSVKLLNPQAERALRVKSEAARGKTLESIWPLREVQELVADGLRQSAILSHEIALPYNVLKLYVIPMSPVTGASAMLIFRDITELRRLEELRNQFLGQVSHELRTPLTIVKGYVVTLLDDPRFKDAPEDVKKILLRIEEEADRLTKLVEELLELSRLKSGKSALTFAPVSLKSLVEDTLESLATHAQRYQVGFEFQAKADLSPVLGDARALKRVLLNLLDNAMKYSKPGSKVELELAGDKESVVLRVEDHGSGIPKEDLPHIFERFFQGKKKSEGKGWGLGLPIVKEIVETHGGRIRIESSENQGTVVIVTLPAEGLEIEERKS